MFKSTSTGKKRRKVKGETITLQRVGDSKWEREENICWTDGS